MTRLHDLLGTRRDPGPDAGPGIGTFLRGLSIGALVGAAIAGSALLQRRRREPATPTPAGGMDEAPRGPDRPVA